MKILYFLLLFMALGCSQPEASTKTVTIVSNGAKTAYQMQFIRVHKAVGTDSVSGEVLHLYLGSAGIDDDFFGVRFYEPDGITPVVHRRMIAQSGDYADFIIKTDIPSTGTKQIVVDYVASGRTTLSSDAALENILFYGWVRQGADRNGFLYTHWGAENRVTRVGGVLRNWFRGPANPQTAGDYAYGGRLRLAESTDGRTWTDIGQATGHGPYEGQGFVYQDPDGLYHMWYSNANNGYANCYCYWTSPTGNNGTWTLVSNTVLNAGGIPSNVNFYRDDSEPDSAKRWKGLFGWLSGGSWLTGYMYGPDLMHMTKYSGNPVMGGGVVGPGTLSGQWINIVDGAKYVFTISGEQGQLTPTSMEVYRTPDFINYTKVGWALQRYYDNTSMGQAADPTIVEFNGKTWFWYESQPDQSDTNPPRLSAAVFDQPISRVFDTTVTTAIFDDLVAEGWTFDSGYGENNTNTVSTVFRKLSDYPSPISQNCVVVKTESGRYLRIRKSIGTLASENVFEFYARAEQINKKFEAFRIDKNATNGILAGVYFDTDGNIKYYNGTTPTTAMAYTASTYYRFQVAQHIGGWDLKINGATIASNIPYYSTAAAPTYFYVGQDSASTGYISGLYTRQYSSPSTAPVWSLAALPAATGSSFAATMKANFK